MTCYEELKTPGAVLAAFEAGRRVQSQINESWDDARYSDGNVRLMMKVGVKFRALIEEPADNRVESEQSHEHLCVAGSFPTWRDCPVHSGAQPPQQGEAEDLSRFPDEFRGDNAHLVRCIGALLSLDAKNALWPHGIGGHAKGLLSAAMHRLVSHPLPTPAEPLGRDAEGVEGLDEDDEFGNPPGYTDWYNTQFFGQPVDTKRDHACEAAWRAALTAALTEADHG